MNYTFRVLLVAFALSIAPMAADATGSAWSSGYSNGYGAPAAGSSPWSPGYNDGYGPLSPTPGCCTTMLAPFFSGKADEGNPLKPLRLAMAHLQEGFKL